MEAPPSVLSPRAGVFVGVFSLILSTASIKHQSRRGNNPSLDVGDWLGVLERTTVELGEEYSGGNTPRPAARALFSVF